MASASDCPDRKKNCLFYLIIVLLNLCLNLILSEIHFIYFSHFSHNINLFSTIFKIPQFSSKLKIADCNNYSQFLFLTLYHCQLWTFTEILFYFHGLSSAVYLFYRVIAKLQNSYLQFKLHIRYTTVNKKSYNSWIPELSYLTSFKKRKIHLG